MDQKTSLPNASFQSALSNAAKAIGPGPTSAGSNKRFRDEVTPGWPGGVHRVAPYYRHPEHTEWSPAGQHPQGGYMYHNNPTGPRWDQPDRPQQISVRSDAGLSAENTSFFHSGSQSHRENRADPRQDSHRDRNGGWDPMNRDPRQGAFSRVPSAREAQRMPAHHGAGGARGGHNPHNDRPRPAFVRGKHNSKCLDCGKSNPKFGMPPAVIKSWCGACAPAHPGCQKSRTSKEGNARADRSVVFSWARDMDPMRCAYWVIGRCPNLWNGKSSCDRIHECKRCGFVDDLYVEKNSCPHCPEGWWKNKSSGTEVGGGGWGAG